MWNMFESLNIEAYDTKSRQTAKKKKLIKFVNKINEIIERLQNLNFSDRKNYSCKCIPHIFCLSTIYLN